MAKHGGLCGRTCRVAGWALVGAVLAGCASEGPKPMAQPSVTDVRKNSDRSFDRLHQVETSNGAAEAPSP